MKKTRKLIAILLACMFALTLLAACGNDTGGAPGGGGGAATPPAGGGGGAGGGGDAPAEVRTLFVAVAQDAGTLHPHGITGAGGMLNAIRTIYDVMFEMRADGSFEWRLVTDIEEITDIEYIFHVRQGVTFSNGNRLTAHDIYFTMNYVRDHPRLNAEVRHVDFENTFVLDDYRLQVGLLNFDVGVFPGFLQMYILNAESYNADLLASEPIGSGPYRVVDYVVNSHLIVEVRDDYWGPRPAIERIHFRVLDEPSQRVNALQTGDVDFAAIPVREIEFVESLGYNVPRVEVGSSLGAFFNMTPGTPLGTLAAREAVMHAINREAILNIAYAGLGTVSVWPSSRAAVDFQPRFAGMHPVYSIGHDPVRARELAEQEGLIGETIRIITNGDDTWVTVAEIIQHDLQEIGINAQIINFDQATYWAVMTDSENFEIAIQLVASPVPMGHRQMNSYPRFFPLGWDGPDRDEYLELGTRGMSTADEAERLEITYQLLQIFMRTHPWFNMIDLINAPAVSPDIGGIEFYLDGSVKFWHWYWVN